VRVTRDSRALRPAVFLDRDGTIIHDTAYIADPDDVRLIGGAASGIARLNRARVPVIIITNQSGIARGLITVAQYEAVHQRVVELLAREGASIDAAYYCPHHPDFGGACECRKPGTLLYRRAAEEHALDLARSWYVGDRWRDIAPALSLGGTGILVPTRATDPAEIDRAGGMARVAWSLSEAVDVIEGPLSEGPGPRAEGPGKD
jgi:histidinol-phosphate phosphatase family protein